MKKILFLITCLLITGCGEKFTICNIKNEKFEQEWKYTTKKEKITNIDLNIVYNNSMFGIENLEKLNTNEKIVLKREILSKLGFEKDHYDGLDIDIIITNQINIKIKADLETANKDLLNKVGFDIDNFDRNINSAKKSLIENGAVCK